MKNKIMIIIAIMIMVIMYQLSLLAYNQYYYLQHPDKPGYHGEDNYNLQDIKPIPFTPVDMSTTNIEDQSKNPELIGYFWDSKDTDNTLLYPGKARIGNDQYINVVAIDSKHVNTSNDPNKVSSISSTNIMNPDQNNKNFNPGDLVKLGTFMKKNDSVIYDVYGAYVSTIVPDPTTVETL